MARAKASNTKLRAKAPTEAAVKGIHKATRWNFFVEDKIRIMLDCLVKAHDLITSPAYVVIVLQDHFHIPTTQANEMWQTDFTDFKIIGWCWMYLSTVRDD